MEKKWSLEFEKPSGEKYNFNLKSGRGFKVEEIAKSETQTRISHCCISRLVDRAV